MIICLINQRGIPQSFSCCPFPLVRAADIVPQWPHATERSIPSHASSIIAPKARVGARLGRRLRRHGDAAELSRASAAGASLSGRSCSRERAGGRQAELGAAARALRGALRAWRPRLVATLCPHATAGASRRRDVNSSTRFSRRVSVHTSHLPRMAVMFMSWELCVLRRAWRGPAQDTRH